MHRVLQEDRIARAEKDVPLGHISSQAQAADIGQYISLRLLPTVVYVHIKKAVPLTAVQILARQIKEHSLTSPTRILLQHRPKTGRFQYHVWLSSKIMSQIDETELYKRILTITKEGKRALTLVLRQNIRRGHIHELWNLSHTLL